MLANFDLNPREPGFLNGEPGFPNMEPGFLKRDPGFQNWGPGFLKGEYFSSKIDLRGKITFRAP